MSIAIVEVQSSSGAVSTVEVESNGQAVAVVEVGSTGQGIAIIELNQGPAGSTGPAGATGPTGPTGATGAPGSSTTAWYYRAKTTIITGNPTDGHLIWNNATQISATSINVSHKNQDNDDIELILGFIQKGQDLFIQDRDASQNFQLWKISGIPTLTGGGTANAYYTYPVTLVNSGGTGTTGFANNHQLLFGTTQTLPLHASTHASGGTDPITPSSIGAAPINSPSFTGTLQAVSISADNEIKTSGEDATIWTEGSGGHIYTIGGYIQTGFNFRLSTGTYTTTLSHSPTADRAIALPNDAGTLALTNPSSGSQTFSGAQTFSGQVELTGQAATNATSAITRAIGDRRYVNPMNSLNFAFNSGWTAITTTGGGTTQANSFLVVQCSNGTTAGSAALYTAANRASVGSLSSASFSSISFGQKVSASITLRGRLGNPSTNYDWAYLFGSLETNVSTISGMVKTGANAGIGWVGLECIAGSVKIIAVNGTSAVQRSSEIDNWGTSTYGNAYRIEVSGGAASCYNANGVLLGTLSSGCPTTEKNFTSQIICEAKGGATTNQLGVIVQHVSFDW